MNELTVIEQRKVLGKDFKIYGDFENPLFLAKDVAEWIEHTQTDAMIKTVDDNEKLTLTIFSSGQNREMWFLTEDGLYEVLMQSRKPIAKQFKKRVKEILKEIRKKGSYTAKDNRFTPEIQAILFHDIKIQEVEQKVDMLSPKVEYLTNHMTIDYAHQHKIDKAAKNVVVSLLGGKESNAYKKVGRKAFQALWRSYKDHFNISSYKDTPRSRFDEAMRYVINWEPDYNLKLEIQEAEISDKILSTL